MQTVSKNNDDMKSMRAKTGNHKHGLEEVRKRVETAEAGRDWYVHFVLVDPGVLRCVFGFETHSNIARSAPGPSKIFRLFAELC
jgi:hypothetical protein